MKPAKKLPMFHIISVLFPVALLSACSDAQHPLDRQLSQLKPTAIVPLEGLPWPAGTLICPLTPYQSELPGDSSTAQRVNAFLAKKQFKGDEDHWSLVVVKPEPAGEAGIEQLVFKRNNYDVITSVEQIGKSTDAVPAAFEPKECVAVQDARVLVTSSGASNRKRISFGTEK